MKKKGAKNKKKTRTQARNLSSLFGEESKGAGQRALQCQNVLFSCYGDENPGIPSGQQEMSVKFECGKKKTKKVEVRRRT